MRAFTAVLLFTGLTASAQSGYWGGYVRGWVNDRPRVSFGARFQFAPPVVYDPYALYVQQAWAYQLYYWQRAQTEQREAQRSAYERQSASLQLQQLQQLNDERERARAELYAQAQALAAQQQELKLKEQELAAQQQQLELERQQAALQQQLAADQKRREEEEAQDAKRRAELAAQPREKGPPVYHWVDADGVENFSTRPPAPKR